MPGHGPTASLLGGSLAGWLNRRGYFTLQGEQIDRSPCRAPFSDFDKPLLGL